MAEASSASLPRYPLGGRRPNRGVLSSIRYSALFAVFLAGGFFGSELPGAGPRHQIDTHAASGVSLHVQPFFSEIPAMGHFPARVTIDNHSGSAREWTLAAESTNWGHQSAETHSRFRFEVPAGETGVFDILIPAGAAATAGSGYRGVNTALQFSGFGVPRRPVHLRLSGGFHSGRGGTASGPFIGMSANLHTHNWGPLFESHHMNLQSARINPDRLPGDWRGLSGFDAIWFTDAEWQRIGGIERRALLDWTAAGGRLFLAREAGRPAGRLAGIPDETPGPDGIPYGFGRIHFPPRDGNELDMEAANEAVNHRIPSAAARFERRIHDGDWALFREVGLPGIPVVLFGGFLAAFVVLIGPVNFLFIAKPGRRYRLLWTTPGISLGAGSLLFFLILFHDGTGGTGMRLAVWHHLPADNKAVVFQDQVTRTGLLVSSRFSTREPAVIAQLNLDTGRSSSGNRFAVAGDRFEGDWFQSRSAQSQSIRSVPATRSRIELYNTSEALGSGDPPEIVSTLSHPLKIVFYRDGDGGLWSGGPLAPGAPLALEPADERDFDDWWRAESLRTSPVTRGILEPHKHQTGYFFASASGESGAQFDTLRSIDWREEYSIHLGPLSPDR